MTRGRNWMGKATATGLMAVLLLLALLAVPAPARADDVTDEVRSAYDLARKMLRKADRASLEKGWQALEARKDEALDSIDYWSLYARLWLKLDKGESQLWDGIVKPRQEAAPKSPIFCLVRARLAADEDARGNYIDAALERSPKSIRARTAKAEHLLESDEDAAWEMLQRILEDDPHAEGALVAMARLALSDGLPQEAIEHLDKALERTPSAELHHLKALAYERWAKNDDSVLGKGLDAAAQAMGMDPTQEHIEHFNELLKQTGDAATATKTLRVHFERTKLPLLGALLAESAFQAGDYAATIMGLSAAEGDDPARLKGLAVAHARLGHAAKAKAAAAKVKNVDSRGVLFAARIDLHLGDASAVAKRLGSLADADARSLRAQAHAWLGETGELRALVGELAAAGSREGEDSLLAYLQAQIVERMGAEFAEAVRKKLLKARFAAAGQVVPQAEVEGADLGEAKTGGWTNRAVTYVRARCGRHFRAPTQDAVASVNFDFSDRSLSVVQQIEATSDCANDGKRSFRFNVKKVERGDDGSVIFGSLGDLGDFDPVQAAFAQGCAACVAGKADAAAASFTKALDLEPAFYRARVFRAVIKALGPGAEKRDAAKDAGKALEKWPDDFEARRMVVFLRAWAGDVGLDGEIEALSKREARYNERDLNAL
jgi:tetratricopeptide (TPR) repeat protein